MSLEAYRGVLGHRDVRRVLLLSLVLRVPLWAGNVILTLHVVSHLGRSYGAAGLLEGIATVAATVSAPWRGRALDRRGLRPALLPSLAVTPVCWAIAPFVGYWPLLLLASLASLFLVPSFSIVRQALIHAVSDEQRTTALAVDSVAVELSFMIGPALGVLLATYWATPWALFACEFASIAAGVLLWLANPPLRAGDGAAGSGRAGAPSATPLEPVRVRRWVTPAFLSICVVTAGATLVLTGTDVGVVAALRHMHHQSWIGWELTLWGLGSAVGGLTYGALHRRIPVAALALLLAGTTLPIALAGDPGTVAGLLFVTGFFCAPTITASVDAISRVVPERVRGEALGWHGASLTAGSALGAPLAGVAIDHSGWPGGFAVPALVGLVLAAAAGGAALVARRGGRLAWATLS